jgi:hypothetical protein
MSIAARSITAPSTGGAGQDGPIILETIEAITGAIAFTIDPARRREGLATQTIRALINHPHLSTVELFEAGVEPQNHASRRTLEAATGISATGGRRPALRAERRARSSARIAASMPGSDLRTARAAGDRSGDGPSDRNRLIHSRRQLIRAPPWMTTSGAGAQHSRGRLA